MRRTFNLSDDQADTLLAILQFAENMCEIRLGSASNQTEVFALRFTKSKAHRLRESMFPATKAREPKV